MKRIILYLSISIASGLLLTNIYTSLIDARSWGSNISESIATARDYFNTVNPGNFFRIFSPINQVLALFAAIAFWKTNRNVRIMLIISFGLFVMADILTFAYFYPRNEILFQTADLTNLSLLSKTWHEWKNINWVRSAVILIGVISSWCSVHKLSSKS